MAEAVFALLLILGIGTVGWSWRILAIRQRATERLAAADVVDEPIERPSVGEPVAHRHRLAAWTCGLIVGLILYFMVGWPPVFASTLGLIVGLLSAQLDAFLYQLRYKQIESQLADAIDLMVGALHAGSSLLNALEIAVREIGPPLRPQLREVLARIRYGDDPKSVLGDLAARVPLETFRLLTTTLAVHWEVGGNLARPLATVGRITRDRLETARRVQSMSTQARMSTIAMIGVTLFIGVVMWRNDPQRMVDFLRTSVGQTLVAGALLLQAVGIVWSSAMSRLEY